MVSINSFSTKKIWIDEATFWASDHQMISVDIADRVFDHKKVEIGNGTHSTTSQFSYRT